MFVSGMFYWQNGKFNHFDLLNILRQPSGHIHVTLDQTDPIILLMVFHCNPGAGI